MSGIAGRKALVTGGARGLGRAIAGALAEAGAAVHILDLPDALAGASLPDGWEATSLDLSAADAEQRLADLMRRLGELDILVANAGVVPPWRRVAALDIDEWDRVFAINVRGVALCLKAAAPLLAASGHGAAILMASINAYRAHPDQTLYTATKHAVLGIARSAALDLGRDGVRVNALAPGPILTDALRARISARGDADGTIAALAEGTALGRMATEAEVAAAAVYLAGATGITGICLPVEAGLP